LPDLVLSDVMMPKMDGIELCRILKSDPETDFIPFVLLTAKASQEDRVEGLKEQADAYLTKPFDPEELRLRIANLIASRRRLKERFAVSDLPRRSVGAADVIDVRSADETFLENLNEIIETNLADEQFSVERLADAVGVSRTQLFRNVRRLTDKSPSELLRDTRLDRAACMLVREAGNVSEIAYATGFKSLAHFSKCFTKKFDCRPSGYREAVESEQLSVSSDQ
jgi:AraC-like DNA-binding protein